MTRAILYRSLLFAALWWISTEGRPDWGAGLLAFAAATVASLALLPPGQLRINPAGLAGFLGYFAWQSVGGGMQVAFMALRPRPGLRPALLELALTLPPGLPRVLMTAVLGLMPGTVGVCLSGDQLRVHVLDERLPVRQAVTAMEAHIARMFGLPG